MNFKVQLDRLEKYFLQNLWLTALGWTRMALESSSVRSAFCLVTKAVCSNRLTGRHLEANRCSKRAPSSPKASAALRLSQNVSVCSALIPGLTILSVRYGLLQNDPSILYLLSFINFISRNFILTKGLTEKDEPMIMNKMQPKSWIPPKNWRSGFSCLSTQSPKERKTSDRKGQWWWWWREAVAVSVPPWLVSLKWHLAWSCLLGLWSCLLCL